MNRTEGSRRQTKESALERSLGLIFRYPDWPERGPFIPAEVSHGHGKPLRAGPGERLKSLGSAAAGRRVGREFRPGFGWQSLILAVIFVVVVSAVLVPAGVLNRIMHGPPQVSPARPDVLVVSAKFSHQAVVTQAVQARGYTVRSAGNVEAGLESLQREPNRIGFVVIAGDMPGARRSISEVNAMCPNARVIVLSGPRDAERISSLLVDAGMN